MSETALAPVRGVPLRGLDDLMQLAEVLFKGGVAPKGVGRPEAVAALILMGAEVGLSPVQALQSIKIVNGRASMWGDALLALVRASGKLAKFKEWLEGTGDDRVACCLVQRAGSPEITRSFGVADARRANLWGKPGPWTEYPERMLQMRARGFSLRDEFTDVLCGLIATEEAEDSGPSPRVEVIKAPEPPPAVAPVQIPVSQLPAPPVDVHGELMVTDEQLQSMARLREPYLWHARGVRPAQKEEYQAEWLQELARYKVDTARKLTHAQAAELLSVMSIDPAAQVERMKEFF